MAKLFAIIAVLFACSSTRAPKVERSTPRTVEGSPRPERRPVTVECQMERPTAATLFERGVRSRTTEAKMKPALDKHLGGANPPISFDLECRDRVCRIRPGIPRDDRVTAALNAATREVLELIHEVTNQMNPHIVYWQLVEPSHLDFRRDLSARIRAEVTPACKRQHTNRVDVEMRFAVANGAIVPSVRGADSSMGECLRAGALKVVDGLEVPPGALPYALRLRLVDP